MKQWKYLLMLFATFVAGVSLYTALRVRPHRETPVLTLTIENAPCDLDLGETLTSVGTIAGNRPARIVVKGGGCFSSEATVSRGHNIILDGGRFVVVKKDGK